MAKMTGASGLRVLGLEQIVVRENVREQYEGIDELAESIKRYGQLSPVLVKPLPAPEDDAVPSPQFELISGHRRYRAVQALHDSGESFTTINALVVAGDTLTLQLVENLQRSDLTSAERERGIWRMCQNGLEYKDVAACLSKSMQYVSNHARAWKVREAIKTSGVDDSVVSTSALGEIAAAEPGDYAALARVVIARGGTQAAARDVYEEYQITTGRVSRRKNGAAAHVDENGAASAETPKTLPAPEGVPRPVLLPAQEPENSLASAEPEGKTPPETLPEAEPKTRPAAPRREMNEEEVPSRQVDFREVCTLIIKYAEDMERLPGSASQHCYRDIVLRDIKMSSGFRERLNGVNICSAFFVSEAANDILALLHHRFLGN